jgi:hypothetical protein
LRRSFFLRINVFCAEPSFVTISCARGKSGATSASVSRDPGHSRQHGHDWSYNEKTGKLSVNKELVLRSKIRIEARQFQMSRLHPQQMGRKTTNRHQKRLGAFDRGGAPAQGRRTHRDDTGVARTAATTAAVGLPPMRST